MHVGMATGFANHKPIDDRRFIKEEFDLIRLGNELGYESVWMTEHHFADYSVSPNPLQYLAHVSGFAPNMWLGTQVIVMPWWDPVRCAEQIAVLDHMSGGKCIIGFGRGLARPEFEGFCIDQNTARERFDAGVGMVMSAMETGFIEGDGVDLQTPAPRNPPAPGAQPARPHLRRRRHRRLGARRREARHRTAVPEPADGAFVAEAARRQRSCRRRGGKPGDPWYDTWIATHKDVPPPKPFMSNMTFVDESADRAWEWARTLCRAHLPRGGEALRDDVEAPRHHQGL